MSNGKQPNSFPNAYKGPDNTAPYPVSRMAPAFDLVDLAKEIAAADNQIGNQVNGKLGVIAQQIRALQEQAREILQTASRDQQLHRARCNFKRTPGKTYHLYQKPDDTLYFSMLAPADWGGEAPHRFLGSYRLENDMSWTDTNEIDKQSDPRELIQHLLDDQP